MAYPDDRYFIGGATAKNWNDTGSWSDVSGGETGASVPGASDNVFLDAASGAVTLTVNVASACLNFDCTGFTGTFYINQTFEVYGNLTLSADMAITGLYTTNLRGTGGTCLLTCNGNSFSSTLNINVTSSRTVQLQDKLTLRAGSLNLQNGILDTNGQDVLLKGTSLQTISGEITFYNLERKPSTGAVGASLSISSNITVTNNLVLDSNSTNAANRLLITSNTRGTQRTITVGRTGPDAGSVVANYCDFEDIKGVALGTASWDLSAATGGSGDCGGNSDITFTTPDDCFQVGAAGNFSAVTWSETTGGATGQRVPLPQDTVILDANSTTGTMTQNLQRIGSLDCTGFTGTLTTSTACTCYGSITLASGMTLTASTQAYTLAGRGTHTLTSAGKTWAKAFTINAPGGSYTLGDAFVSGTDRLLSITSGTFDANDFNLTIGGLSRSGSATAVLDLGNGTWTMQGIAAGSAWGVLNTNGLTITPGTSTIKFTGEPTAFREQPMAGTYHNVEFATTGSFGFIVRYAPTFSNFKVAPGSNVQFYRSETVTAATWELEGTSDDPITLASDDATLVATIAKSGGGIVHARYCTITRLNASPRPPAAQTFYASDSTGVGDTTGWVFNAPPTPGSYKPRVFLFD
jgi:hypothetical protein